MHALQKFGKRIQSCGRRLILSQLPRTGSNGKGNGGPLLLWFSYMNRNEPEYLTELVRRNKDLQCPYLKIRFNLTVHSYQSQSFSHGEIYVSFAWTHCTHFVNC